MKKLLSLTMAAVMFASALPLTATAKTYYLGDVGGNGKVEAADAASVLNYSIGKTASIDVKVADITKDNKVNSSDALEILKTSVGKISPVQVTVDDPHVAKPIGKITKQWSFNKTNFSVKIERVCYGKEQTLTINAKNKSDYNNQIVNYKTIKYWPMSTIMVITPKNGTRLRFSKGGKPTDPETLAKNIGAEIAMNGMANHNPNDYYDASKAATIRDGAIYIPYKGVAGKAARRFVVYKNGDWKLVTNFDNETAKAEIAKGAWVTIRFQDLTVMDGKKTTTFKRISQATGKEFYRFQNFIGHTYDGKIIFMTSEMIPLTDVADILIAYNCKDAVMINGGNNPYLYVKGIGNTTGSNGASIKGLNKVGYLETEWFALHGFLAAGKGGGVSYYDLDVAYFK